MFSQNSDLSKFEIKKIEKISKLLNGEWNFKGYKNISYSEFFENGLSYSGQKIENRNKNLIIMLNLTEDGFVIQKYISNKLIETKKSEDGNLIFQLDRFGKGFMKDVAFILTENENFGYRFIDHHFPKIEIIKKGGKYLIKSTEMTSTKFYKFKVRKNKLELRKLKEDRKRNLIRKFEKKDNNVL